MLYFTCLMYGVYMYAYSWYKLCSLLSLLCSQRHMSLIVTSEQQDVVIE